MTGKGRLGAAASRRKPQPSNATFYVSEERLAQIDKEIYQLEQIVDNIKAQVPKYKRDCKEELQRMSVLEREDFRRQCLLIPPHQLKMTIPEVDKLWSEMGSKENNDAWILEEANTKKTMAVKVPVGKSRFKRRSTFRPTQTSTPIVRMGRTSKKFTASQLPIPKNVQPRPGRVGERAYSENGSPLVISIGGTPPSRPGKLVVGEGHVLDLDVF